VAGVGGEEEEERERINTPTIATGGTIVAAIRTEIYFRDEGSYNKYNIIIKIYDKHFWGSRTTSHH